MPESAAPLRLSVAALADRLDGFVTDYLKSKSPETRGTYRRTLNEFERYHATRAARPSSAFRFVEKDVEAYKTYLMEERELSQVSVSTYLTALRRFEERRRNPYIFHYAFAMVLGIVILVTWMTLVGG